MLRQYLLLLGIVSSCWNVNSQGIDKLWLMGYSCCHPMFSGMNLDFSTGILNITTVQRNMSLNTTNGLICDQNNNLLFYSNGIYIANALDDTMMNGSGLNPSAYTTSRISHGLAIPQANLVIPIPGDSARYYLFHETSDDRGHTYATYYLYYSIIDMSLDSGRGAVVQKNTVLLADSLVEGRLTACKHANGRDWWLFAHKFHSTDMYSFLVTDQGIQGPWLQNAGAWRDTYFGQCVFSQQGDKFAYYEPFGDLDVMDFDRCTGLFSNIIHVNINDSAAGGGAAFSPSGRFLYVSSQNYIYQLDMLAANIPASILTVGVYDGFTSGAAANFYLSQLAADGKIYTVCGNSTHDIHVINYPDSAGLSCDFCQHCIALPAFNAFTIPNFPNYFLGPLTGSVCDSLTSVSSTSMVSDLSFSVFPNPAKELVYITLDKTKVTRRIKLYNIFGQEFPVIYSVVKNSEYLEINMSQFNTGIYLVEFFSGEIRVVRRVVKE